jgi:hypothetical protein
MTTHSRSAPKWLLWITLAVIVALIGLRLYLPYFLLGYVTRQINKIPGYHVRIRDLDVHLWRGSYTIKELELWKIRDSIPVPFYKAESMDLSVEWAALIKGAFVATIVAQHPVINFVTDDKGGNDQFSIGGQWLDIVKSLFPLRFDQIAAHQGEIYLRSYTASPPFKIFLNNVEVHIDNMQNADHSSKLLYSTFVVKADSSNSGTLEVNGKFNPVTKSPTFFINASLKNMNVLEVKSFLKHYTNVDVQGGRFSLYAEAAAADGKIKGYVKPFIKDLKIAPNKNSSPLQVVYDGAAAVVATIMKNPKKQTIATQVNISGNIDNPDDSILSIIGYMIRHAFIQALAPQIDHDVKMQDVLMGGKAASNSHNKATHN